MKTCVEGKIMFEKVAQPTEVTAVLTVVKLNQANSLVEIQKSGTGVCVARTTTQRCM